MLIGYILQMNFWTFCININFKLWKASSRLKLLWLNISSVMEFLLWWVNLRRFLTSAVRPQVMPFLVPGSQKPCIMSLVKTQKIHIKWSKSLRYSNFAEISVSQVFLDPIQNRVSAWSVHLEAAYFEALLYFGKIQCQY